MRLPLKSKEFGFKALAKKFYCKQNPLIFVVTADREETISDGGSPT